jgi:uncharacterized protein
MDKTEEEPVWYSSGLSFECTQCGNCCSGPSEGYVWLNEDEIRAIASEIGMSDQIEEFERKFTRRVGTRTSLVEYSDGDCIFLDPDTRTCSVYVARPMQCRTWPFWKQTVETPKAWARTSKQCPGCNRGRLYSIDEIKASIADEEG